MLLRRRAAALRWACLTDDIMIGAAPSPGRWEELRQLGVTAVLDLRRERPEDAGPLQASGVEYLRIPVTDGEAPTFEELEMAVNWVLTAVSQRRRSAIVCRVGRGRSALVGAASLVALGFPLEIALQMLVRAQPKTELTSGQVRILDVFAAYRQRGVTA